MTLRFVLAAYGAAVVSFLMSLLRDYAVIHFSGQGPYFFQLLYVVSMAAGFGVNAIALGRGGLDGRALALLAGIGFGVICLMLPAPLRSPRVVALSTAILLLWIAGAYWSRALVERGRVVAGRIREAIASLALALLVLPGVPVEPAFLLAVAGGTAFSWLAWTRVRSQGESHHMGGRAPGDMRGLAQSLLLTNAATLAMTWWALVQTGKPLQVLGLEVSTAVRFSMYVYQVLTIGSVVLVTATARLVRDGQVRLLIAASALAFAGALFLPLAVALFVLPLAAAVAHYALVLQMQQSAMVKP